MPEKPRSVSRYLEELRQSKKDKPEEVKEALEIYIQLWENVMEKGLVGPEEKIGDALKKIDADGGLYRAAGESSANP